MNQSKNKSLAGHYTRVIPAGTVGENRVAPATLATSTGACQPLGGRLMESNRSACEHEARVRLRAIGQWLDHLEAGECTLAEAVGAVTDLTAAVHRCMSEPEAA